MRAEARKECYKSFFYHQSQSGEQAYNTEHGGDTSEQGNIYCFQNGYGCLTCMLVRLLPLEQWLGGLEGWLMSL